MANESKGQGHYGDDHNIILGYDTFPRVFLLVELFLFKDRKDLHHGSNASEDPPCRRILQLYVDGGT